MKLHQLFLTAACLVPSLSAVPITYAGSLLGTNENPIVVTPGSGFATVIIDTAAHTLVIDASFSGLIGTTTAAHIHCCVAPTGNAGVATQTPSFAGFPLGVTSGTYSNTYDLTLATSFNPAFITANGGTPGGAEAALAAGLAAGMAYFNVHTSFAGGGEVRANLTAVPEPGTLGLTAGALLLLVAKRLRRV